MDKNIDKIFRKTSHSLKKFINNNKFDLIIIFLIIIVAFIFRLLWLDQFPPNITGDEAEDLSSVYQIMFDKSVGPFTFFGDGSIPAIVFYPVILFIKIFGINNSLFSLRLNIVIYSVLSVIPFYLIIKKYTKSITLSALFTFAMSCNYVYLNFSRTAWINMMVVFTGLFLILFIRKALEENKTINYIFAGFFAGLSLYSYHYGKVLVFLFSCFLLLKLVGHRRRYLKKIITFFITILLITAPLIILVYLDSGKSMLGRPKAVYAFSRNNNLSSSEIQALLRHQLDYTFKGFISLDGKVMSEGVENMRYVPFLTSPVNLLIKMLFITGLIYFLIFDRKNNLLWLVFLSILITQILSVLPPNYSRGLFYIPFIYLLSAIFISKILLLPMFKVKKHLFIYFYVL